jgi:hypothetical protein
MDFRMSIKSRDIGGEQVEQQGVSKLWELSSPSEMSVIALVLSSPEVRRAAPNWLILMTTC